MCILVWASAQESHICHSQPWCGLGQKSICKKMWLFWLGIDWNFKICIDVISANPLPHGKSHLSQPSIPIEVGIGNHSICAGLKFHSIPSKTLFVKFIPTYHKGCRFGKAGFSVQIWKFHPSDPSSHEDGEWLNITFLHRWGHNIKFLAKTNLLLDTPNLSNGGGGLETWHFCAHLDHLLHF